jgi:hypothetical protein
MVDVLHGEVVLEAVDNVLIGYVGNGARILKKRLV